MLIRWLLCLLLLFPMVARADATILVFGDSLSANYGIPTEAGWVSLLQARLASQHPSVRVVNASISGETTSGGVTRIGDALRQHRPSIVILELGANDGLRGLPLATTRANLEKILHASTKSGAHVLLIGMRLPPNFGPDYTKQFAALYPELAARYRIALVPFLLEPIVKNREAFQDDGLHPKAEFEPQLLETVWGHLEPLIRAYGRTEPLAPPPQPKTPSPAPA